MGALEIINAYRGLTTGDQDPPRPWAHMSHVGSVTGVTEAAGLTIRGWVDTYAFEMHVDGRPYRVMVQALDEDTSRG